MDDEKHLVKKARQRAKLDAQLFGRREPLKGLLLKLFITWKRTSFTSLLDILLPVLMMCVLCIFRARIPVI
jgi:hypothetical protein